MATPTIKLAKKKLVEDWHLTFGVELEFLIVHGKDKQYWEAYKESKEDGATDREAHLYAHTTVAHEERKRLVACLDAVNVPTNRYQRQNDVDRWMVHSDGSVKAEKDELPGKYVKLMDGSYVELSDDNIKDVLFTDVEISSRILPMENNSMEEIDRVIGVVREKVAAFAPRSAGLHVHVGNRAVGFNARTAKNFLTLMCICQTQWNELHPPHRLTSQYCKLITTAFKPKARDPRAMATVIESLDTLRDIVNIFGTNRPDGNLPEHSWTYNITNLVLTPPKLTIEFRQHMGTLDPDIVRTWVMFALATINVSNQATNPFVSLLDFVGKDQYGALQALDSMFLGHMKENFAGRIWTHDRSQSIEDFIWGEVDDPDDFPLDY